MVISVGLSKSAGPRLSANSVTEIKVQADEIEQLRDENTFLKKGNVGVCEAIEDASEEEMTLEEMTAEIQQLLNAYWIGRGWLGAGSG